MKQKKHPKHPIHPCVGCVYFAACGSTSRTMPCEGRMTKMQRDAAAEKEKSAGGKS